MALFQELNDQGITILIVTHEAEVSKYARRIIEMRDGRIIHDHPVTDRQNAAEDLKRLAPIDAVVESPELAGAAT